MSEDDRPKTGEEVVGLFVDAMQGVQNERIPDGYGYGKKPPRRPWQAIRVGRGQYKNPDWTPLEIYTDFEGSYCRFWWAIPDLIEELDHEGIALRRWTDCGSLAMRYENVVRERDKVLAETFENMADFLWTRPDREKTFHPKLNASPDE